MTSMRDPKKLTRPKNKKRNPKRMLCRFQLLDVVVKIALAKFKTGIPADEAKTNSKNCDQEIPSLLKPIQAVRNAFELHIIPCAEKLVHRSEVISRLFA
jgi:hypothetical protein